MIREGSLLKLGEKYEYVVVFSTIYNGFNYVYLTNIDNNTDSCFYKNTNNGHLEVVKDRDIIDKLLKIFKKNNNH